MGKRTIKKRWLEFICEDRCNSREASLQASTKYADTFMNFLLFIALSVPLPADVPALRPAIERLAQSLAALKASHATNTNAAESLVAEQEQLDAREVELREMIAKAETKRSWFAEFKDWMESVATFLDEKVRICMDRIPYLLLLTLFVSILNSRNWRTNTCLF